MIWLDRIIFWIPVLITGLILLFLLVKKLKNKSLEIKTLRYSIIIVLVLDILLVVLKSGSYRYRLSHDEFGKYLMQANPGYFWEAVYFFAQPLIFALGTAILMTGIVYVIKFLSKRSFVDATDLYIVFLVGLIGGFPSGIITLLGSFLLMIVVQIARLVIKKENSPMELAPFLLIMAIAILILSNFNFYLQFLSLLRIS